MTATDQLLNYIYIYVKLIENTYIYIKLCHCKSFVSLTHNTVGLLY